MLRSFTSLLERNRTSIVPGRKHWLAFAALGVIWGTTWVATDALNEGVPSLLGAAARFFLAALVLLPVIRWKRWKFPRGRALLVALLLSVTMIVLPVLLLFWARPYLPSATVTALYAVMPLVVMLMTPALGDASVPSTAMNGAVLNGVIGGFGGILLALGASFSVARAPGAAVVLLAVFSTGVSSLIARRELIEVRPVVTTTLVLGAAAPLLLLASLVLEHGQAVYWDGRSFEAVLYLAVVPGALGYAAWFWLLKTLEAYQMATVQWLEPLVGMAEGAILLRMGWSFSMIAGSVLAGLSLWMVMRARPEDDKSVSLWSD